MTDQEKTYKLRAALPSGDVDTLRNFIQSAAQEANVQLHLHFHEGSNPKFKVELAQKTESVVGDRFEHIANSTIINRSTVEDALNSLVQRHEQTTANALIQVIDEVKKSANLAAASLLNELLTELKQKQPKHPKLLQYWDGLVAVLPSIAKLGDAAAQIAKVVGS